MDRTSIFCDDHINALGRTLHKFSTTLLYTHFVMGDDERIRFWANLWWGDQSLCS